jgi:NitT/TauT family transport system substrate-binding protein
MRMRRSVLAACSVLALATTTAACGDDDDDGGGAAPATEAPGTDAPATTAVTAETAETTETTTAATDGTTGATAATDTTTAAGGTISPIECDTPDPVTLQLQWFIQAQFGGYYAAIDQGFYDDMCLDVTIAEGGVDIVPQQVLADGNADFAIAWVPKALQTREQGADIVDIAQIFQRSGTLQVSFADAGITSPDDFAGKNIGNWGFGNEYEIFAALAEAGLDPAQDVTLVQQQFDMAALLNGDIDAAEAMTYNEYAQVLEAENPDTGELYQPEDFNVISYEDAGVGMLQDAIWADGERLANDEAYLDIAVRFVAASIQGWAYCRDDPQACRDIVVAAGSQLGDSHQLWQMNEVNKLIWPAEDGIGVIDEDAWNRTVEIAQNTPNLEGATVLTAPPTEGAFTNDIVNEALALLGDSVDTTGDAFEAIDVTLEPGGS